MDNSLSIREERIRKITHLYYSKPEIQKAIFDFSINREISPRYFEGFGKRPDTFQYESDVLGLARKGATSFHCSEELWSDPLQIATGMKETELNSLRTGWDLLIDIDCKWFDFSKLAAKAIIDVFENNQLKNFGIKFSGSKGFHIIVPWKAFPKEINGVKTSHLFPEVPRKIVGFIRAEAEKYLRQNLPDNFVEQFKNTSIKRGIKCNKCREIAKSYELTTFFCNHCMISEQRKVDLDNKTDFKCPNCKRPFDDKKSKLINECVKCGVNSLSNPDNFSSTIEEDLFELMGLDLVLVAPRHLFRMPYSLHEKTALVSVVLDKDKISEFQPKDADPFKIEVKNFMPNCEEGEARRLLIQSLDWAKEHAPVSEKKIIDFKPIQITDRSEKNFPPCIKKILEGGAVDGKKRALFALLNFLRSIGVEKDELESMIYTWNDKNKPSLQRGYVQAQISWALRHKPTFPPNCKEFYQGIGVCNPEGFCHSVKNPINFIIKKNFQSPKKKTPKNKDNFKNDK